MVLKKTKKKLIFIFFSTFTDMEQEELLKELLKKDDKSFTLLYDNYSKSLFGVIYNLIRNTEEAEDVLQEVFVKIWKNIDSYNESKGRLYTWMLNIARNTSIDKLRSKNFNNSQKNLSTDNFVHILEDNSKTTNRIDAIGIKEFIMKLKPKCIQIIDLLFFKGYTQQEASDELEMPLGTVKTNNRNCMNELRKMLHD
ncbi:MAG: RNA polymerase sigma-70 factor (ECF subfamily) [Flavobacterium sp.]